MIKRPGRQWGAVGEGPAYGFHGSAVVIKASGEHTLGQIGVMESAYPRPAANPCRPAWVIEARPPQHQEDHYAERTIVPAPVTHHLTVG